MAKVNFSSKEFTQIVKGATKEINGVFKSPFVVVNLLNKAAKGDFSKIEGCTFTPENLAKVAKVCKSLHGGRYAFDLCLFEKDSRGRFCTLCKLPKAFVYDTDGDAITYTYKGGEIVGTNYMKPIACTINGVFAAFAKVAKIDITETEKAEKAAQKAAEKAAKDAKKEYEKMKKGVIADYNKGMFGEAVLAEKLAQLKEIYANVA